MSDQPDRPEPQPSFDDVLPTVTRLDPHRALTRLRASRERREELARRLRDGRA